MSRINDYIPVALRRLVTERAGYRCEYCLLAEQDMGYSAQIDHIISLKHGGTTESSNLAFACWLCNTNKGPDVGSIAKDTKLYTRFFNPRTDIWAEHFRLDQFRIEPLTAVGEVTARIFQFNTEQRVEERALLF